MIRGLQKLSLIDYPGKIACTVFLAGCNFRCPFCHNVDLVLKPEKLPKIEQDEFFSFLEKRKDWLEAVCITGGEPTIHSELPEFVKKIKEKGFLVKLDTNGSNPSMLSLLLRENLLDYVALDIKAPLDEKNYSKATGIEISAEMLEKIKETISLLEKSKIKHEFRITVVPTLHTEKELLKIAKQLNDYGIKKFTLQQFFNATLNPNLTTIDPSLNKISPYSKKELKKFKELLKNYFKEIQIKNII